MVGQFFFSFFPTKEIEVIEYIAKEQQQVGEQSRGCLEQGGDERPQL